MTMCSGFTLQNVYALPTVLMRSVFLTAYGLSHPLQKTSHTPWLSNETLAFGFPNIELTFLLDVQTVLILCLDKILSIIPLMYL